MSETSSDVPTPTSAPEAGKPAGKPGKPEKLTPLEWAKRLGQFKPRDKRLPQSEDNFSPAHSAANKLYGWSEHAYHYQGDDQKFVLTEADYKAALKAALEYPLSAPHPAALPSDEHRKRFANFKPKERRSRKKNDASPKRPGRVPNQPKRAETEEKS